MINFLPGINSTTSALTAERIRMDVISQNIANANTTHGVNGQPYQRQEVVFENVLNDVRVAHIQKDQRPALRVHNPGHPDADANGMVAMPNVNIHQEMADLLVSSRAFEANLAVLKNARTLALQTLNIGKRT